ncbi:uncharacterized protein LOC107418168 isoform X2 [Ziziphus jujuba]|uniref:Uncharacterized protein LOC107418168 isoform X2 n=1 Tax=Ziziphus jujuba TaxID=326968 RepID=A0ABM3IJ85_ZIZJJ|nr:uncharacterized protein LOC107418168 isoform X2 [Ziziphus jujuba]
MTIKGRIVGSCKSQYSSDHPRNMASFKLAPKIFTCSAAPDSETDFLPFGYSYFRMTKRKIGNTTTIIDLDPPISEISNLCTYSRRKKITNQDHEEKFPWFLNVPRGKRSKWKISPKNADHDADAVSKHETKQDSRALISRKNAEDGADALSKQDKKPNSRALISHKNAVDGANAVSKQDKKLDSQALVSHKNADYDADAVSKQDKKLSSRALVRHKDADNADEVSKRTSKLDSGIFECYLENLWRSFPEDQRTSCTYFDCLWFTLYKKVPQRSKLLSWIKKKRIFSKKYVFVPIVCCLQSESRTTCMLLLDSLEGADPRRLEPDIRKFIFDIYKAEGRPESKDQIRKIPLLVPKVPQQRDGEECGSFVLYFISLFMEGAPEDFSMKGYPYFMKQSWFTREGLECFLKRLDSFPK